VLAREEDRDLAFPRCGALGEEGRIPEALIPQDIGDDRVALGEEVVNVDDQHAARRAVPRAARDRDRGTIPAQVLREPLDSDPFRNAGILTVRSLLDAENATAE